MIKQRVPNKTNNINIKTILSQFNFTYQYNPKYYSYADYCMLICKGKKGFLWCHTTTSGEFETLFIDKRNANNNFGIGKDIEKNTSKKYLLGCNPSIGYKNGTLLYGTLVNYKNINSFIVEDILLYFNEPVYGISFDIKLILIYEILNNYLENPISLSQTIHIFLSPIIDLGGLRHLKDKNGINYKIEFEKTIMKLKNEIPTEIFGYYFISRKSNLRYFKMERQNNQAITMKQNQNQNQTNQNPNIKEFWIKAEKEPDTYLLFNDKDCNYVEDFAYIDTFKLSKKMNSLFRIIRENENLDNLEESDDEMEFENINERKYLKENVIKMPCVWQDKIQKWKPEPFNFFKFQRVKRNNQ